MYTVTLKNINTNETKVIHDVNSMNKNQKITRGEISQSINEISSFDFEIYPNNIGFNFINSFKTHVEVYNNKTKKFVFKGRVLIPSINMSEDGLIVKSVTCEDRLAYLCDSIVPLEEEKYYEGDSTRTGLEEFIDKLLDNHNSRVEDYKKIYRGIVTVKPFADSNNVTKSLDGEQTTFEAITEKLIDSFGGEIQLREDDNGILFLDYVEQLGETKETTIELSKNMKTAKKETDPTSFVTRLYPYGATIKEQDENGNEVDTGIRLDITSVNNGISYIEDEEAKAEYGIIEKTEVFDDITVASNLLSKATSWLSSNNKVQQKHTITYLDLYLIGIDAEEIELYNSYPVKNKLMNIDDTLRVIKKTIDIVNPQESTIDVGDNFKTLSDIEAEKIKEITSTVKTVNKINSNYTTNNDLQDLVNEVSSSITQLSNLIGLNVSQFMSLSKYIKVVSGNGYVILQNTSTSSNMINKVSIKGFTEKRLYPGMAFPSSNTYPNILTTYTIIQDVVDTEAGNNDYTSTSSRELGYFITQEPLRTLVDNDGNFIYDEVLIESNNIYVYRRLGLDSENNIVVLDKENIEYCGRVDLHTFESPNGTFIKIKYFDDLQYEVKYMEKNEFTNSFLLYNELSSTIELLNNSISLKVDKNGIISAINMSEEEIAILASKIKMEGYTTINNGFSIDLEGNMSCQNAKMKNVEVIGGNIYLPSGGQIIGGDGLLTNLQFTSGNTFEYIGYSASDTINKNFYEDLKINYYIPDNFKIVSAYITLINMPVKWIIDVYDDETFQNTGTNIYWGFVRNLKLYKQDNSSSYREAYYNSEHVDEDKTSFNEIANVFGANGYTPSVPTDTSQCVEKNISTNIASSLSDKFGTLSLRSGNDIPEYPNNGEYYEKQALNQANIAPQTSLGYAILNIIGFMSN